MFVVCGANTYVTSETARTFPMTSKFGLPMSIPLISLQRARADSPLPAGFLGSSRSCPHLAQEKHQKTVTTNHTSEMKDRGVRDTSACQRNVQHWFAV